MTCQRMNAIAGRNEALMAGGGTGVGSWGRVLGKYTLWYSALLLNDLSPSPWLLLC